MAGRKQFHHELYDMLLDYADLGVEVENIIVGLNWTLCRAGSVGLAPTVAHAGDAPSWHGGVRGTMLGELAGWLTDWDRLKSTVGLAAVNAALNREADIVTANGTIFKGNAAMQHSIDWFVPLLQGKRVALLGPRFDALQYRQDVFQLEHFYRKDGALHPAWDTVLEECDWIFVNARAIADKSLPHILERVGDAHVVLYGAGVPWLEEWRQFGVDYLLGCEVDLPDSLQVAVSEGQDVEQQAEAIHLRLIKLQPELPMIKRSPTASIRQFATA